MFIMNGPPANTCASVGDSWKFGEKIPSSLALARLRNMSSSAA